jgi:hypothetical protein
MCKHTMHQTWGAWKLWNLKVKSNLRSAISTTKLIKD